MFWKKTDPPKESKSTAIVRQDSRTTIKTSTTQTETTTKSVKNATEFNDNKHTVAYRTTTQTVTHQQKARITEITKRYTPTPEELEELLRAANLNPSNLNMNRMSKKKHSPLPAINFKPSGKSPLNSPTSKIFKSASSSASKNFNRLSAAESSSSNLSPSPLIYSHDSANPRSPTIAKIEKTFVTQSEGRKITKKEEQHNVKLQDAFKFVFPSKTSASASNSPLKPCTPALTDAKPFKLSSPNSPLTKPLNQTFNKQPLTGLASTSTTATYSSPYAQTRNAFANVTNAAAVTPATANSNTTAVRNRWLSESSPIAASTERAWNGYKAPTITNSYSRNEPILVANKPASNTKSPSATKSSSFTSLPELNALSTKTKKKSKLQPGHAYIFNNERFDNPNNEYRVGSAEDVKLLKNTLETYKLKVHLIDNATLDKINSTVKKIETKDFNSNSCLVIVILSHGSRHEEICAKDGSYSIDDAILFPILRNRSLTDKPKLFFIQACKGAMESGSFHKDAVQPHGSPNEILKCYSTFEGYVSYRSEKGSFFIQTLCEFLKLFGGVKNIRDIMEIVTLRVKQLSGGKQIPAITSTLTQPYVFGDYI